ncbi:SulP family sulfate permease [Mesorhizobium soli]|uniref:SulP family inorganic anion transporter n=1 Tax=Pseudaminobacter soli (ex Li et al. 2025) TaxID=1295366 RepID=UPI0024747E38|nr:SulP family inorganic anion transporter [Mesorhizobium soli]MDH6233117.1 SulP family sulfate permease [Mesorhizobium soli]
MPEHMTSPQSADASASTTGFPLLTRNSLHAAMFGLIAGIDGLGTSVAFAALIFSGGLSQGFGTGVSVMLLSSVILAVYVSLRSRYATSVAQVQETTIAILASAVTAATGAMAAANADEKVSTAFAILGASTLATGVFCYLSGRFRLGALVRFLPYPVVAGFLAGSGWLLLEGALMMVTNADTPFDMAQSFRDPAVLGLMLPSILFALAMAASVRLSPSPLAPPILMLVSIALFYLCLWAADLPVETARASGWLPDLSGPGGLQLPSPLAIIREADWMAVLSVLPMLVSVPLIAMAGLLLNTSALELAAGRDIDANAELKTTGQANIVVGLLGGASGFTGLSITLLARRLGVTGRSTGIATAAVMAMALPFATALAAGVPLLLAAGLMMMLGGELLYDWALATRRTLPRLEWAVVLAIVLSMMAFGFMTGMAAGLICSVVTFVFNYARLPVIRLAASGHNRRSSNDRSAAASHLLNENGHRIHILELQNYLFFGTMEQIVGAVRRRFAEGGAPRFLILDFRNVSGADSAAVAGFSKIFNMAAVERVEITLSALPPAVRHLLKPAIEDSCHCGAISVAVDLDHALEACEEQLLGASKSTHEPEDIALQLGRALGPHPRLADLVSVMERVECRAGEKFISAGEEADDIFVVGSGSVKVQVTLANGRPLRLRGMTAGAVLGEVAFYLGGARTADVIVERHATLFKLTRYVLEKLETQDPELAVLAHRLFARALAERLTIANRLTMLVNG